MKRIAEKAFYRQAAEFVLGAKSSIALASWLSGFWSASPGFVEDLVVAADPHLKLRWLVDISTRTDSGVDPGFVVIDQLPTRVLEAFLVSDWQFRPLAHPLREHLLIIDSTRALVVDSVKVAVRLLDAPDDVAAAARQFDQLWAAAERQVLYEAPVSVAPPVLLASKEFWDRLIGELTRQPELLHTLPSRKFEELVAELLARDGLHVTLTPQSRDKGRDVLAVLNSPLGNHLYLVECKRWSPTRPVGLEIVQRLHGVVEEARATMGLVVTSSRFTKDAVRFREKLRHRLSLRDFTDLVRWIRAHAGSA